MWECTELWGGSGQVVLGGSHPFSCSTAVLSAMEDGPFGIFKAENGVFTATLRIMAGEPRRAAELALSFVATMDVTKVSMDTGFGMGLATDLAALRKGPEGGGTQLHDA